MKSKKKTEKHECLENFEADGGMDMIGDGNGKSYNYGNCNQCGRRLREVYDYVETEFAEEVKD